MNNFYARAVLFTSDAERSLRFYTEQLGFATDWKYDEEGRPFVVQVSLFGFELILNRTSDDTAKRAGHGRVFVGLEDDQVGAFREHINAKRIAYERVDWGRPTLLIRDIDGNELFFWLPHDDFSGFTATE